MRKTFTVLLILFSFNPLFGQPNCNWYKYHGETKKYEACMAAEKRVGHYQFSKEYQIALDDAIKIDSTWAYAYRAKSTAYLKSGDFINWKNLMDKAVLYDTIGNLDYRGWCRFQFFRDYKGAIEDLLLLKKLTNNEIGYSVNGDYHLDIALALCFKSIGQTERAIQIIKCKLEDSTYSPGLFDHLHLGVMYLEVGEIEKAIEQFQFQEKINDLAENRFYLAVSYRLLNNSEGYKKNLNQSKNLYQKKQRMFDPYTEQVDKIFLVDIENEEKNGLQQHLPASRGFVLRRKFR